jgi:F-type H+-transporting ATPase subunit b
MDFVILAQEHGGAEHGGGGKMNPLDMHDAANHAASFWALGIFLVLFFVLWKFAWGPILKGLASREDRINASLKRAEEIEKATRELEETNRKVLEKAQQEAQQIVHESRVAAGKAASEIAAKAQHEIEEARDRFKNEMRLEAARVKDEIRKEAVAVTIAAAGRLIGRSLTDADHVRLAEESLRDAESVAGS